MSRLMLVGATGLVGHCVLQQALADARVRQVVAPTRSALPPHPKLLNPLVDFDHLPDNADWWAVDAVVCTLGTTIKTAGSQAAFYRVDHGYPLQVARLALRQGAKAYALNSALGADPASRVFYSRTKGELEQDLQVLGYRSLTLVRPGLIGGERRQARPAEQLAVRLSTWLQPLLPRRYRVVPADRIAHHLLQVALAAAPGVQVLMSERLL
ncbi:MAG: NAD-dependent dehydratase [Hydrogenophaga sp.]|uniref:NAD-dependent dehydratase n=1 Tax=Hydrogenophaga sp. TaxID=1904254 RepID=UPI00271E1DBD|nr:NAD-dependent dehydratase [Hydrogenophaga sp.]MDO9483689.1 NAD-dependent dehydratase [Hydrogenophaga sp.]MDP3343612.1 NAD-dependent dehydratase [Hydrogenophaga sp.]MDP3806845.1 NAD-dependent dehydratase [Hydrogenophaga sp.]